MKFKFQFIAGKSNLGIEPNLCLLKRPDGKTWIYVTSKDTIYIHDAHTGTEIKRMPQMMSGEPIFADNFYQVIYIPDEHDRTGIYAYTPDGQPFLKNGSNRFGNREIIQNDAEGIWIYSLPDKGDRDFGKGFIILSDQREDITEFEFFDRQTWEHLGTIRLNGVNNTDGIASTQTRWSDCPAGLFVAIDDDRSTAGIGWGKILEAFDIQPIGHNR